MGGQFIGRLSGQALVPESSRAKAPSHNKPLPQGEGAYEDRGLSGRFDLLGAVGCMEACDELFLQGEAFGEPFGEPVNPSG